MSTPSRTLGRYELIARIGEGGMAEVYLARQRGPRAFEKLVVVKTVHSRLASKPALAEALLEEARIAAKVRHPHVVDIYDLGEEDGTYFIAMEYLEGESMTSVIRAQRARGGARLPPLRTAQVVCDCASGLHAAHELRSLSGEPLELVHQDVTPGNVFVLYTGQAKLLDFGVAKVRSSEDGSLVKGKAGYLAPELFDKHPADRRSDVFSLGVVLWESLTLRRLFSGATEADTFAKIRACEVPPPSTLVPDLPPELDQICARALTRSRDERYPTARAMQDDLNALLRGAERNDYEAMATYMRSAFASHIAARHQLLKELDAGGVPASATLEALGATFDERSPATPEPGREATPASAPAPAKVAVEQPPKPRLAPLPSPRGRVAPLPSIGTGGAAVAVAVAAPVAAVATEALAPAAESTVVEAAPLGAAEVAFAPGAEATVVEAAPLGAAALAAVVAGGGDAPGAGAAATGEAPAGAAAAGAADDEVEELSGVIEEPSGDRPPVRPRPAVRLATGDEVTASGELAPAPAAVEPDVVAPLDDDEPLVPPGRPRRWWIAAGLGAAALVIAAVVVAAGRGSSRDRDVARSDDPGSAAGVGTAAPRAVLEVDAAVPAIGVDAATLEVVAPAIDAGDRATPHGGSATPHGGSATPHGGSAAPPGGSATPPGGSATPPGGSATPPDGGSAAPPPPDPARAAALAQAGLKQVMAGNTGAAIGSFQAALRADRTYAPAQRGLGLAYEKQGDKARAARAFRAYLALAPNARDAAQIRARLENLR